jgi:hypothetical protein
MSAKQSYYYLILIYLITFYKTTKKCQMLLNLLIEGKHTHLIFYRNHALIDGVCCFRI